MAAKSALFQRFLLGVAKDSLPILSRSCQFLFISRVKYSPWNEERRKFTAILCTTVDLTEKQTKCVGVFAGRFALSVV